MELTRSFTADQFARALESWDWADIQGKQPLFTSPFGDVFFQAQDGFWFLDLLEGTLTRPWSDAGALQAEGEITKLRVISGRTPSMRSGRTAPRAVACAVRGRFRSGRPRMCAGVWLCAGNGALGARLTRLKPQNIAYISFLYRSPALLSPRVDSPQPPASPAKTYIALVMGTICPFVGPATDKQGA